MAIRYTDNIAFQKLDLPLPLSRLFHLRGSLQHLTGSPSSLSHLGSDTWALWRSFAPLFYGPQVNVLHPVNWELVWGWGTPSWLIGEVNTCLLTLEKGRHFQGLSRFFLLLKPHALLLLTASSPLILSLLWNFPSLVSVNHTLSAFTIHTIEVTFDSK